MLGKVKWFNVKNGYGFITGDNKEDYFVHRRNIKTPNPSHAVASLNTNERVAFTIKTANKGPEAIDVTGPEGKTVTGHNLAKRKQPRNTINPLAGGSSIPSDTITKIQIVVTTAVSLAGGNLELLRTYLPTILKANNLPSIIVPNFDLHTDHDKPPTRQLIPRQALKPRTTPKKKIAINKPINRVKNAALQPSPTTVTTINTKTPIRPATSNITTKRLRLSPYFDLTEPPSKSLRIADNSDSDYEDNEDNTMNSSMEDDTSSARRASQGDCDSMRREIEAIFDRQKKRTTSI